MLKRAIGGAHYGLRDWLAQRMSALIMLAYSLALLGFVLTHQPLQYADWRDLFQHQFVRFFTLLFALALFVHAWVGVRDVLMDYVRASWLRLTLQTATIAALLVYTMWTVSILWGVR